MTTEQEIYQRLWSDITKQIEEHINNVGVKFTQVQAAAVSPTDATKIDVWRPGLPAASDGIFWPTHPAGAAGVAAGDWLHALSMGGQLYILGKTGANTALYST